MFDITIVTTLASFAGCLCMGFVCATQLKDMFARPRSAAAQPWEPAFSVEPACTARVIITPAHSFGAMPAAA